jgi:putative transposase
MRARHPQHLRGFDYLGPNRYSLPFCTEHRREVFTTALVVELVNAQFLRAGGEHLFAILAHCFMPDHLHLLVEGMRADSDLRRVQAAAKQYSGFYYKQRYGLTLWQRYGYERVLRSQEQTLDVVRYILANPIRAGLAKNMNEYPFSGSSVYSLEQLLEGLQVESG